MITFFNRVKISRIVHLKVITFAMTSAVYFDTTGKHGGLVL